MDIILKINEIINYSGIVQGFFLAAVLFTGKTEDKKAGYILGVLLALFSINIIHSLFLVNNFLTPLKFREPFITLLCPFLYFYALEINQNLKIDLSILRHFVLFFTFFLFHASLKIDNFQVFAYTHDKIFSLILIVLMLIQFSFYIFQITKITKLYDKKIENEFSSIDELNISWIKFFLAIFIIIYAVFLLAFFFLVHMDYSANYSRIIATICAISIYILGYKGIKQQPILKLIETQDLADDNNTSKSAIKDKPTENKTTSEVSEIHIEKIRTYMKERKPYLDPDITLSELAAELNIGRNTLSFVINSGFKQNFFNFVNKYRVEEFISFFDDPAKENSNLLTLAYDAGFNSKATFNHIFKKFTGFTPKEYKLRLKSTNTDV